MYQLYNNNNNKLSFYVSRQEAQLLTGITPVVITATCSILYLFIIWIDKIKVPFTLVTIITLTFFGISMAGLSHPVDVHVVTQLLTVRCQQCLVCDRRLRRVVVLVVGFHHIVL